MIGMKLRLVLVVLITGMEVVINNSKKVIAVVLLSILAPANLIFAQASFSAKEVSYQSDTITIAATLYLPDKEGPFPVAVLVPGSGGSDRSNIWMKAYVEEFLERDIAVLYYDKRGTGKSGGDWKVASFYDLADDVLAGVNFVHSQLKIDTARIALVGFSQGSSIISIAASSPKVDLAVSVSGSVVSLSETIMYQVRVMGQNEDFTAQQIQSVDSLNLLAFAFAKQKRDMAGIGSEVDQAWNYYDNYRQSLLATAIGGTKTVLGFPADSTDSKWSWLANVGGVDSNFFRPLEHWKSVNVPILFLYGGRDENVDAAKGNNFIASEFARMNKNFVILYMGLNGHGLIREDAMDFITRWIADLGAK